MPFRLSPYIDFDDQFHPPPSSRANDQKRDTRPTPNESRSDLLSRSVRKTFSRRRVAPVVIRVILPRTAWP